jgi:hypothetical protein
MPTAIVFSNLNILTLKLVEKLLASSCEVFLVTDEPKEYKENLLAVSHNPNLKIFSDDRYLPHGANYVFSVNGFGYVPEKTYFEAEIDKNIAAGYGYAQKEGAKSIYISPLVISNKYQKLVQEKVNNNKNLKEKSFFVYLGEVYGKNMNFFDGSLSAKIIKEASFRTVVNLPDNNQNIYYVYYEDAIGEIIKRTFSFGFEEGELGIAVSDSAYNLFRTLQSFNPEITAIKTSKADYELVNVKTIVEPQNKKANSLKETMYWLSQYAVEPQNIDLVEKVLKEKEIKPTKIQKKKTINTKPAQKFLVVSLITLLVVLVLPFLTLFISGISLKYSLAQMEKGSVSKVERLLKVSELMAGFSAKGLSIFSSFPIVGEFYTHTKLLAQTIHGAAKVSVAAIDLSNDATTFVSFILNDEPYDAKQLSDKLSLKSRELYESASSLQSDIDSLPPSVKSQVPAEKISKATKYLAATQAVSQNLAELVGYSNPKTYLVLFQNNMELRPTGGFIGSFALVTFNKGKLADISVMDVYEADGQLKGHIEPPAAIKDYLGEANWYLRDSNWDPDFPTSAVQAEWFLDKEIGRSVNGVVSVDLELAKNLLEVTGPVKLAEYNDEINFKNMYEKVQYEVEEEFFPGSTKKANYLTSLTRSLVDKIKNQSGTESYLFGKVFFAGLESKHVQLYIHDPKAQEGIKQANWDGSMTKEKCGVINCQISLVSFNDANVGVNKANYFIQKNLKLDSKIEGKKVKNILEVTYKNQATPALGLAANYKAYLRLITDKDTVLESVEIIEPVGTKFIDAESEYKTNLAEYGSLFEIKPGQVKTIKYTWSQDLTVSPQLPGKYVIQWEKQAGTVADPIEVNLAGLTAKDQLKYNTNLAVDKFFPINW